MRRARQPGQDGLDSHLQGACARCDWQAARELVQQGADINAVVGTRGASPLVLAVQDQQGLESIDQLLALGADPNAADEEGWTALHLAAKLAQLPVMQVLVAAGANLLAGCASRRGRWAAGVSVLHFACAAAGQALERAPAAVRWLLERGVDPGALTETGFTPLHIVLLRGVGGCDRKAELVQLLLAAGADCNDCCGDGFTPLHHAARTANAAAQLLIAAGAAVDAHGRTPCRRRCGLLVRRGFMSGSHVTPRCARCCWLRGQTSMPVTGAGPRSCTPPLRAALPHSCSGCWWLRAWQWMRVTVWEACPCTWPLSAATSPQWQSCWQQGRTCMQGMLWAYVRCTMLQLRTGAHAWEWPGACWLRVLTWMRSSRASTPMPVGRHCASLPQTPWPLCCCVRGHGLPAAAEIQSQMEGLR